MSTEEINHPNNEADPSPSEDAAIPAMEQAQEKIVQDEELVEDQEIVEDDPLRLDTASSLSPSDDDRQETQADMNEPTVVTPSVITKATDVYDDMSDADSIPDDDTDTVSENTLRDWSNEKSTRAIAIELKHIETEVRNLLNSRDAKRKRKLAGSRRWQELEDDLISWRFSNWMDEETILQLQRLVARRNYLFTRLRFLASTRPTWNS